MSKESQSDNIKAMLAHRNDQYAFLAFILLMASLGLGTQPGVTFTVAWAALAGAGFFMSIVAFPNVWRTALGLICAYLLSFLGMLCIIVFRDILLIFGFPVIVLFGVFLGFGAIIVMLIVIAQVKQVRDADIGGRYIPLGLWSISGSIFMIITAFSTISWYFWATGFYLIPYLLFEVLLILCYLWMLWLPDRRLNWDVPKEVKRGIPSVLSKTAVIKRIGGGEKNKCPACGSAIEFETRMCKKCGKVQKFGWCPVSEIHLLPCAHCRHLNTYGNRECELCHNPLAEKIKCPRCEVSAKIGDWPLKPDDDKEE